MATVQETVTRILIEKIEARRAAGEMAPPWRMTWSATMGAPRNLVSEKPYRGFNLFTTMCAGYSNPFWVTMKQCNELGGRIKAGERSMPIVFWLWPSEEAKREAAAKGDRVGPMVRYYRAWNGRQTEGLEQIMIEKLGELVKRPAVDPIAECERVLNYAGRPELKHGAGAAFYRPSEDRVYMPEPFEFESAKAYYHVRFHEEVHATGHQRRLAREGVVNPARFGSHAYSAEELVAEMGSAMLAGLTGIGTNELADNSAAYLDSWLRVLKAEPTMLLHSAGAAQRAVDHILGVTFEA